MNQRFVRLSFCAEVVLPTRFVRYAALAVALLGSSSIAFAQETVPDTRTDLWLTNPVNDATFQTYLEFFAYNKSLPFDAVVGETITEQGVVRQQCRSAPAYRYDHSPRTSRSGIWGSTPPGVPKCGVTASGGTPCAPGITNVPRSFEK